jgi:hypothetical protein
VTEGAKLGRVQRFGALGAVAVAAMLTGLVFVGVQSGIRHRYGISDLLVLGAAWVVFAVAALLVTRLPVRLAVALILAGGVAMEVAAFSGPPHLSDDVYRYIWDGRVQAAGIDPYEYVPAAPQLISRRDPLLWPAASHWCVRPGTPDPDRPGALLVPGCSKLNRPWVHTIYPPVAEAYFFAVEEASPTGSGTRPMQAGAGLAALAVTGLLLGGLARLGRDPRLAVLWAWCPTVVFETGNDAHVDVLAAGLTVASLVVLARARTRRRAAVAGSLLGLAVATKLYPLLVAPAVARRRPVSVASAAVAAVAAVYLPHLIAIGAHVLGYLPGYLQEEGYGNGSRFALLRQVLPTAWCGPVAVAIMALTALVVMRYADPLRPADGAVVLVGVALILTSPAYPWYTELVVALAALAGRAEWLPLAFAACLPIFGGDVGLPWTQATVVGYATAAAVAIAVTVARVVRARRRPPPRTLTLPTMAQTAAATVRTPVGALALTTAAAAPLVARGGAEEAATTADTADTADTAVVAEVILPCLDEAAALPYVLGRLPTGFRAIVVDNGSSDGSAEVASRLGAQVVHEPRRGFGAACHAGLLAASAAVVCFCDCDGSLDPAELPKVAGPVLDGTADLVLGRRRPRGIRSWPPHARIANVLLARRVRRATGAQLRDLGPMRAARREPLVALGLRDRRFGYPLEMVLAAAQAGWRIRETDVRYVPRTGRSKVTGTLAGTLRAVRDMRRAWKAATG